MAVVVVFRQGGGAWLMVCSSGRSTIIMVGKKTRGKKLAK